MSLTRVLRTSQMTLSHTFYVDGVATDPADTVTVVVKRLDGTVKANGNANAGPSGDGKVEFVLPGSATQEVDTFTVDWTGTVAGASITVRDYVEVVGGFYFGIMELRETQGLTDAAKYPDADLAVKRIEAEQESQSITGHSFVPRFSRFLLDGTGTDSLIVPDLDLRVVRAASMADRAGGTFTALTAGELGAVAALSAGVLVRDDGGVWTKGHQNVLVEYEYGLDYPPEPIRTASMRHCRALAERKRSGIPDRAIQYTTAEGATYRLMHPGLTETGIPDVDRTYGRYTARVGGFA